MFEKDQQKIVDYVSAQLIGPMNGPEESLVDPPSKRYLMGMLFPQNLDTDEAFGGEDLDEQANNAEYFNPVAPDAEKNADVSVSLATQFMPSSVGLSFLLKATGALKVEISAGLYKKCSEGEECEKCQGRKLWHREDLFAIIEDLRPPAETGDLSTEIFNGQAKISSRWRLSGENHLVTIALVNEQVSSNHLDHSKVLSQVKVECVSADFLPYPTPPLASLDDEDKEFSLIYRDLPIFAVGHGCSAGWSDCPSVPEKICTDFLPDQELPGISFDIEGHEKVRDLRELSNLETNKTEIITELRSFAQTYREWITKSIETAQGISGEMLETRDRIAMRLHKAADRIEEGISLLDSNSIEGEDARTAFSLANRAVLMQMHHVQLAGKRKTVATATAPNCDYNTLERYWRPFQLAFILMTIPSASNPDHDDRDVVDLIWFPTGGGKTEAYLGLVAYQILLRRLQNSDDGAGTAVITRYTLRLLTSQQFQRSATLICALELIRRKENGRLDHRLGEEGISIGLWVGGDSSPNTCEKAAELLQDLMDGRGGHPSFQIGVCPWCGTEIIPENPCGQEGEWGIVAGNDGTRMHCPNTFCSFSSRLPISVVDEDLYRNPPTFLIATIDKFARLTWEEKAGVFLGTGKHPGPSLIIQDELHLVSGPLGTVAALYEAAFDILMESTSCRPKLIASTATIRRATEQVRGLFDREVFQFPPTGLSHSDSFFVKNDSTVPGRRYLGVMAQSHTPVTANVHTTAVLLQAPIECNLADDSLDAYWTLVSYYNSLRELGKSITLAHDDIPDRIRVIATDTDQTRKLNGIDDIQELTSQVKGSEIPKILERLGLSHHEGGENQAISLLPCSNMISVGVDVPRLSLMMVNGQPKTTSEYIQATSRVGRDSRRPPGLVLTLYSAARPRDRSHYESFKVYHQSIHRSVEATSVTPWALPARNRALHAALVILVRHQVGLSENNEAKNFPDIAGSDDLKKLVEILLDRTRSFDPREVESTQKHLLELIGQWRDAATDPGTFRYQAAGRTSHLLKTFKSKSDGLWPTLHSMRNVDTSTFVDIIGEQDGQ
jgi:hypothetical protein